MREVQLTRYFHLFGRHLARIVPARAVKYLLRAHPRDLSKYNRRPEQSSRERIERYSSEKSGTARVCRATMTSRIHTDTPTTSIRGWIIEAKPGEQRLGGETGGWNIGINVTADEASL